MPNIRRSNVQGALGSAFGSDHATDDDVAKVEAVLQGLGLRISQCYHVSPVRVVGGGAVIQFIFSIKDGTKVTKRTVHLKNDMTSALDVTETPFTVGVGGRVGSGRGYRNQARHEGGDR